MNTPVAKKLSLLGLTVLFAVSLGLPFASMASAAAACDPGDSSCSRPYIKSTGGDVSAGGWYDSGGSSCLTGSNYQDSNITPPAPPNGFGGILAFANANGPHAAGGSSSEFAAYALGLIQGGDPTNNWGFYSGGAQAKRVAPAPTIPYGYTSFANTTPWGGVLVPASQPRQTSFCIPDYFDTKLPSPAPGGMPACKLSTGAVFNSDGVYYEVAGSPPCDDPITITSNDVTVPAINGGRHVTVFVKGSVYISHNITYDTAATVDSVPKFALVVQGSIYIDPSVTRLDGLYIAQPDPAVANPTNADTGDIWTCHNNTPGPVDYTWVGANCSQKLTVNGAFIAKRIDLTRTSGDVGSPSAKTTEDGFCAAGGAAVGCSGPGAGASEVINFSPAMVVGGPFFSTDSSSSDNPTIESVISLPPIF